MKRLITILFILGLVLPAMPATAHHGPEQVGSFLPNTDIQIHDYLQPAWTTQATYVYAVVDNILPDGHTSTWVDKPSIWCDDLPLAYMIADGALILCNDDTQNDPLVVTYDRSRQANIINSLVRVKTGTSDGGIMKNRMCRAFMRGLGITQDTNQNDSCIGDAGQAVPGSWDEHVLNNSYNGYTFEEQIDQRVEFLYQGQMVPYPQPLINGGWVVSSTPGQRRAITVVDHLDASWHQAVRDLFVIMEANQPWFDFTVVEGAVENCTEVEAGKILLCGSDTMTTNGSCAPYSDGNGHILGSVCKFRNATFCPTCYPWNPPTQTARSGTMLHEVGHALGLQHLSFNTFSVMGSRQYCGTEQNSQCGPTLPYTHQWSAINFAQWYEEYGWGWPRGTEPPPYDTSEFVMVDYESLSDRRSARSGRADDPMGLNLITEPEDGKGKKQTERVKDGKKKGHAIGVNQKEKKGKKGKKRD